MGKYFACEFTYVAQVLIAPRDIFRVNLHVLRKSKNVGVCPSGRFPCKFTYETNGRRILHVNLRMLRNFLILIPTLGVFRVNLCRKRHGRDILHVNLHMLRNFLLFHGMFFV